MKTIHSLGLALAASLMFAPAAFAQPIDVAAPLDDETQAALEAEADAEADVDPRVDRRCLRYTGSRVIADPVAETDKDKSDPKRRRCATASGRVYTREDLEGSGHITVEEALRALDPGIY